MSYWSSNLVKSVFLSEQLWQYQLRSAAGKRSQRSHEYGIENYSLVSKEMSKLILHYRTDHASMMRRPRGPSGAYSRSTLATARRLHASRRGIIHRKSRRRQHNSPSSSTHTRYPALTGGQKGQGFMYMCRVSAHHPHHPQTS